MKSKMKSAFAIIAVAFMIMVAVVPMATVFTGNNGTVEATAIPTAVPAQDATTNGITLKVVDNAGTAIPYATLSNGIQLGASGSIKISWADASGKTYTPAMPGFTFTDASGGNIQSITISANVPADSPNQEKVFKANEKLNVVSVSTKTNETINDGTITYPTASSTATVTVYSDGKAYVPEATGVTMSYTLSNGKATVDGVELSGFTSEAATTTTVTAKESVVKITVQDDAANAITPTGATFTPAAKSGGVSTTTANLYVAAVDIGTGYTVQAAATNYTFDVTASSTSTAQTVKANERQALIVVKDSAGAVDLTQGTISVTGTDITSQSNIAYNATAHGFPFVVKKTSTAIGVTFAIKDDATNDMAVTALSGLTYNDFTVTKTVKSTDKAYAITGNVTYAGSELIKMTGPSVVFGSGTKNGYDSTAGTYALVVKENAQNALKFTSNVAFLTPVIVSDTFKVTAATAYNFVVEQKEKVAIAVSLKNTLTTDNALGEGYVVKFTPTTGDAVNATWDATDKVYKADLARAISYTVSVADCDIKGTITSTPALSISSNTTFSLSDANSNKNSYALSVVLDDVAVSGYAYAKYVTGDENTRPLASAAALFVYGKSVTTDENGKYTSTVPHGVSFVIYDKEAKFAKTAGNYWSSNAINAIGAGKTVTVNVELFEKKYDAKATVAAHQFGLATDVHPDAKTLTYKIGETGSAQQAVISTDNKYEFYIDLNGNLGQTVDVYVTAITFEDSNFTFTLPAVGPTKVTINPTSGTTADAGTYYADQVAYQGTVKSANGVNLNGKLTFTSSPTATTTKVVDVNNGTYFVAIDCSTTAQQLYKVSFTDSSNNKFTIWDGQYRLPDLFRVSFTPGATRTADVVSQGTLSTTISGAYVATAANANLKTLDYALAGYVISNKQTEATATVAAQDIPLANVAVGFTWKYTAPSATSQTSVNWTAVTGTDGRYYLPVLYTSDLWTYYNALGAAIIDVTLPNDSSSYAISAYALDKYSPVFGTDYTNVDDVAKISVLKNSNSYLALKLKSKLIDLQLKDAFTNYVAGTVTGKLYVVNAPTATLTVTFTDGKFSATGLDTSKNYELVLDDESFTLVDSTMDIQYGTATVYELNQGLVSGKVAYVNDSTYKMNGTIIFLSEADGYEMAYPAEIKDGNFSGYVLKGDDYKAYLAGGDYALQVGSSTPVPAAATGKIADPLNADLRTVTMSIVDGQGTADIDATELSGLEVAFTITDMYGEKAIVSGETDEEGKMVFDLPDAVSIPAATLAINDLYMVTSDEYHVQYSSAADEVNIEYSAAATGKTRTMSCDIITKENRMVLTFIGSDLEAIDGMVVYAKGFENGVAYEDFYRITDENGQITIEGAYYTDDTHDQIYELSNPIYGTFSVIDDSGAQPVIVTQFYKDQIFVIDTVTLDGMAYVNKADKLVADEMTIGFYLVGSNYKTLLFVVETDEFGAYTATFPAIAGWKADVKSGLMTDDDVTLTYKAKTDNVIGSWIIDDIDFAAVEISGYVGYRIVSDAISPYEDAAFVTGTLTSGKLSTTIMTDIDGRFSLYVPAVYATDNTPYELVIDNAAYDAMNDVIEGNMLSFNTGNEYRLYVPVAFDGHAIDGAVVEGSNEGVLYYVEFDASAGIAVIDGIEIGDYLRAVADGYEFDAVIDGVLFDHGYAQFDGDSIAFVGSLIVYTYTYEVDFGENTILSKYVDIRADDFKLQLTLLVADPREEISVDVYDVTNHKNLVKKFEFQGWNVNGELIKDANTAIYYAEDPMTLSYLVAPMFKETTEDVSPAEPEPPTPPEPVTPSNEIDQNILILGIVAVVIAILSVVLVLVKNIFSGRKDEKDKEQEAQ